MSSIPEIAPPAWPLLSFLREELAPWQGRFAATVRIAGCCTVVVAVCMVFQIPETAYAAYLVFMASQREATSTLLTGVVAGAAATFSLFLSIALYALAASEPALRLPLMAGATFIGMYLSRVLALGPMAFLSGFVVVITQTLIDSIPNLEALVRLILWLWIVVMLPVVITVLVDLFFGRKPAQLARISALKLLDELAHVLRHGKASASTLADVPELAELRKRAALLDRGLRGKSQADQTLIEILGELLTLSTLLPPGTPSEVRQQLALACAICRSAFEANTAPDIAPLLPKQDQLASLASDQLPVVMAISSALRRLADGLERRLAAPEVSSAAKAAKPPAAGAFSNRDHALFALKTTIAAMAAYIIYTGLAWPGIRTCVVTCFFVALTTFGETVHKLTLRLSGALIGGLLGGLCVVFVMPWMTDIGQLCLLIAVASLGGAWISTSSPRLSYCGAQMAFAFFLTVLQGYAPTDDLTAPRDRVVGILLGNVLMSLVFSVAWPVSAAAQARAALGRIAHGLAELLRDLPAQPGQRMAVMEAVAKARQLLSISLFEHGAVSQAADAVLAQKALDDMETAAASAFVVAEIEARSTEQAPCTLDRDAADWLEEYAQAMTEKSEVSPLREVPKPDTAPGAMPNPQAAQASLTDRSRLQARQLLLAGLNQVRVHAL
ncbi:MAG: hypothetical protein JWR07_4457 [Nevskia sp.]|nr:hypothetical protein [Nevskia sp.]